MTSGRYFVLLGHLSPIDGIGPEEIGIDQLIERLSEDKIKELILATNLTVEGEATAHYISERAKGHIHMRYQCYTHKHYQLYYKCYHLSCRFYLHK